MRFPRYPHYKQSGAEWMGTEDGVRVVRLQNIREGRFDGLDCAFIAVSYWNNELSGHDVIPDDVLIAGLGDDRNIAGRACVAPGGLGQTMVKADCLRFRIDRTKARPEHGCFRATVLGERRLRQGRVRCRVSYLVTARFMPGRDDQ